MHVAFYDARGHAFYSCAVLPHETPSAAVERVRRAAETAGGFGGYLRRHLAHTARVEVLSFDPAALRGWRREERPDLLALLTGGPQPVLLTQDGGV